MNNVNDLHKSLAKVVVADRELSEVLNESLESRDVRCPASRRRRSH